MWRRNESCGGKKVCLSNSTFYCVQTAPPLPHESSASPDMPLSECLRGESEAPNRDKGECGRSVSHTLDVGVDSNYNQATT